MEPEGVRSKCTNTVQLLIHNVQVDNPPNKIVVRQLCGIIAMGCIYCKALPVHGLSIIFTGKTPTLCFVDKFFDRLCLLGAPVTL